MTQNGTSSGSRAGRLGKAFGSLVLGLLLIGVGFYGRGLLPGPPGGPPGGPGPMGPGGPPTVFVEKIAKARLSPPEEYIGRVEAVQGAELVAHVQGYVQKVHFEEGGLVTEGDLLVTIRQDDYRAQVAQGEAVLAGAEASLVGAKADVEAAKANLDAAKAAREQAGKFLKRLGDADERSIVQADLDTAESTDLQAKAKVLQGTAQLEQARAGVQQAKAAVQQAKANLDLARINLGYTEIRAPITGRIGQALFTKGDLVGPASGPLAKVVQVDPIRVVYSLTDRQYLTALADGGPEGIGKRRIRLRLPNGRAYPKAGTLAFENNEINPRTGSLALRASFANADRHLVPGSYVTVLLDRPDAPEVLVAPEESIVVGERGTNIYVVDAEGKVELRPVEIGRMAGGRCEIKSGLSAGDAVIVQGVQLVRPGLAVRAMPASPATEGETQ